MRARLALLIARQTVELREVDLRRKPDEMLAASPKGSVPVLVLPDGRVIDESYDIMQWSLARNDPDRWLAVDRTEANEWVRRNDEEFKRNLDGYKYAEYHPEKTASEWRQAGESFLRLLDERLRSHEQLFGDSISIVDAALLPFVRQFAHVDRDWDWSGDYPGLKLWLENWLESGLFRGIMTKYPRWLAGAEPVEFGADPMPHAG